MKTRTALLYAAMITLASCILLTIVHGLPSIENTVKDIPVMFIIAFVVMKLCKD